MGVVTGVIVGAVVVMGVVVGVDVGVGAVPHDANAMDAISRELIINQIIPLFNHTSLSILILYLPTDLCRKCNSQNQILSLHTMRCDALTTATQTQVIQVYQVRPRTFLY